MRLKTEQAEFIKTAILQYRPEASVYLFGSRAHDHLKGGDIDILVISEKELTAREKREIKIILYREFGHQKIDIASFKKDDPSAFKELALMEAVKI